mmetsp:Transcript_4921/g.9215  ORF Transcript_4921/g.9215 Transcript_4921/m.9215 type:complete len:163 (-) Transcript_4921:599-1087(-)
MSVSRRTLSKDRAPRGFSPAEEGILNQIFGQPSSSRSTKPSSSRNTPIRGSSPSERSTRSNLPPTPHVNPKTAYKKLTTEITSSLQSYENMVELITSMAVPSLKEASLSVVGELQASPRTLEQVASEQTEVFYSITQTILKEILDIKARVDKVERELDAMGV